MKTLFWGTVAGALAFATEANAITDANGEVGGSFDVNDNVDTSNINLLGATEVQGGINEGAGSQENASHPTAESSEQETAQVEQQVGASGGGQTA